MEQKTVLVSQTCVVQKPGSDSGSVMEVLRRYSDLYMENPENIYRYFELMLNDQKPAVSIEIYGKSAERVVALREDLERFFFVFGTDNEGSGSHHLSVSKIRSIAKYVSIIEKEGFSGNAGTIGLLLGYKLNEVMDYVKKTREDGIK
ncbi:MAG: hypothetical protein KGI06_01275 [Candidatus Micrarchaeota archaeon]|nr:hypothetical protein [Candidatus Micrarchaeota archaeon]